VKKLFLLLLLSTAAAAQYAPSNATATATVVDSDGTAWANGTWNLKFNPINQASIFKIGGLALDPAVLTQTGTINGLGALSISLYENTTIVPSPSTTNWVLTLCPNASGKCGAYSFFLNTVSTDLSAGITSAITAPRFKAVAGTYGYTDLEASLSLVGGAQYVNVSIPCLKFYSSVWSCLSTSGVSVIGSSTVSHQSTSQSTVVLVPSAPSTGKYRINYYADQNALCGTGSNVVFFDFQWTDLNHSRTTSSVALALTDSQSANRGSIQGTIPIEAVSTTAITYTSTVSGSCSSGGPSSYDVRISVESVQ
jgi:hypothetical protein